MNTTTPKTPDSIRSNSITIDAERQFARGDLRTASDRFIKAIKLDNKNSRAWNGLGVCYHSQGQNQEAINAFEQALFNNPNDHLAAENIHFLAWATRNRYPAVKNARLLIEAGLNADLMQNRLELTSVRPSKRRRVLVMDSTSELVGQLRGVIESSGAIADEVGPGMLVPLSQDGSGQTEEAIGKILDSLSPSMVIASFADPAHVAIGLQCHARQIPSLLIGNARKGKWTAKTSVDEFLKDYQSLLDTLPQEREQPPHAPLFSVIYNWPDKKVTLQNLLDALACSATPIASFEVLFVAEDPAELKKELAACETTISYRVFSGVQAAESAANSSLVVLGHPEESMDPITFFRLLKENINIQYVAFGTDNFVKRSTARACALVRGWGNTEKTRRCLTGLRANHGTDALRIVYIDNGSDLEEYIGLLRDFPDVEFFRFPENMGSCRGINAGMLLGSMEPHEFYILMDNDADPPLSDPTWLERWMGYFKDPKVGAAGATSYYVGGKQNIELCPETYMKGFNRENGSRGTKGNVEVHAVVSFAAMYRRKALQEIGWLSDEQFEPGNCEDTDLCFRMVFKGWKMVVAKSVWINHEGSQTFNRAWTLNDLIKGNRHKLKAKFGALRLARLDISFSNTPFLRQLNVK